MSNPLVTEINVTTGEEVTREMTDAEFAAYQALQETPQA
jgi:hypothetical protein